MALTILYTDVASQLGVEVPNPIPDPLTGELKRIERLFSVASAIITEYARDSSIPAGVENEALVRLVGFMASTAKTSQGVKSQQVDDLKIEYFQQPSSSDEKQWSRKFVDSLQSKTGGVVCGLLKRKLKPEKHNHSRTQSQPQSLRRLRENGPV